MTIRKNDPNSPFWKAAEEASRRVDKFPPWKLGVLEPRRQQSDSPEPGGENQNDPDLCSE